MYYNFVRIHQTLKVTPAMAAGVTDKLWEVFDIVEVLEQWELATSANVGAGSRTAQSPGQPIPALTKRFISGSVFKLTHYRPLTKEQKRNYVPSMFTYQEAGMLKVFVEEAAALASIVLFVGMIAVWAQLLPQL